MNSSAKSAWPIWRSWPVDEVDLLALKQAGLVGELIKSAKIIKSGELKRKVVAEGHGCDGGRQGRDRSGRRLVRRVTRKSIAVTSICIGEATWLTARVSQNPVEARQVRRSASAAVFLLLALVVYRIGAHIPVPGIDPDQLAKLFKSQQGGILGMFNMFSGGALSRFTVFALGIMPYISASIIMQLMAIVVPQLEALKKEGEAGRRKITQYTRLRHLGWRLFQALGIAVALENSAGPGDRSGHRLSH